MIVHSRLDAGDALRGDESLDVMLERYLHPSGQPPIMCGVIPQERCPFIRETLGVRGTSVPKPVSDALHSSYTFRTFPGAQRNPVITSRHCVLVVGVLCPSARPLSS